MNATEKNKVFYNKIASDYEKIDGRRKPQEWIERMIRGMALYTKGEYLLDVGAGSGYISNIAAKYFKQVVAIDISQAMLDRINNPKIEKVCMGIDDVDIWDGRFDAVVCFATLHHLPDHHRAIKNIAKALTPQGIFWSDHDLDGRFYKNFKSLIDLYRMRHVFKMDPDLREMHEESETHNEGIDISKLQAICDMFFQYAAITTHWEGTLPIPNCPKGWAPFTRCVCVKEIPA